MLEVATECLGLNNYNSIVHIMSGLLSAPIVRLRRTWKSLSDTHRNRFRSLRNLMASDDNFASYRSFLSTQAPPCVPHMMLYIADLAKADRAAREANVGHYAVTDSSLNNNGPAPTPTDEMINFVSVRQVARTIDSIMAWQKHGYTVLFENFSFGFFFFDEIRFCLY